jgi:hypothetical protein
MDWVQANWTLVTLAWEKSAYLSILLNPLGLIFSGFLLVVAWQMANARKFLHLLLFAVWTLAPLHHFTLEGRDFVHTEVAGGYGGLSNFGSGALFFLGAIVVGVVIIYVALIRD